MSIRYALILLILLTLINSTFGQEILFILAVLMMKLIRQKDSIIKHFGAYILISNTRLNLFLALILLFSACSKNADKPPNDTNAAICHLAKINAWDGILDYISKYSHKSKVFQLQVINDEQATRIQISYLLKQEDITKRPPFYYESTDNALILVYNGLEEFNCDNSSITKLKNEPFFKLLIPEENDSFLIYHPPVWEFIIDENKKIVIDTTSTPFNHIRIKKFIPPTID